MSGKGFLAALGLPPRIRATTRGRGNNEPTFEIVTPPADPRAVLPIDLPEALRPEAWQSTRGLVYRTVVPQTGLSQYLRTIDQAYRTARLNEPAIPDDVLAGVPLDPGALDAFAQSLVADMRPRLDAVIAAIDEALQHANAMQAAIGASPIIPRGERNAVADIAADLNALRNSVGARAQSLADEAHTRVHAACRTQLEQNAVLTVAREQRARATGWITALSDAIAQTTTVEQLRANFGVNNNARSLQLLIGFWETNLQRIVPSLIAEIGQNAMRGMPEEVVSIAKTSFLRNVIPQVESEIANRLAAIETAIERAEAVADQRENEARLAQQARATLEARGRPVPQGYVANAQTDAVAARAQAQALRARRDEQRAAVEPAVIAESLAPLADGLANVAPGVVEAAYGALFRRLHDLVGYPE